MAALTKVGAWADRVVLDDADLVPVPDGLDPEAVETLIVNGVTAWRMLHRAASVRRGQTIVVLGAAGGVGTVLVQLARHAGIRVIGTAGPKQQERLRALGVTPIDYRCEDVAARVRELAPDGVAAVFDHVGGPGIADSWRMLARGGTLVSYGTAATKDVPGNPQLPVLKLLAKLTVWNGCCRTGARRLFFNLWAGHRFRRDRFRARAARGPRARAGAARRRARSRRRSPRASGSSRPPRRCASPRPAATRARSCSCRSPMRRASGRARCDPNTAGAPALAATAWPAPAQVAPYTAQERVLRRAARGRVRDDQTRVRC